MEKIMWCAAYYISWRTLCEKKQFDQTVNVWPTQKPHARNGVNHSVGGA
jgi:hypothetical protein